MRRLMAITLTASLMACTTSLASTESIWEETRVAPTPTVTLLASQGGSIPLTIETAQPRRATPGDDYTLPTPLPFTRGEPVTEFGVQINGCDHDPEQYSGEIKAIGFTWVKQQVRWGDMAPRPMDILCTHC